MKTLLQHQRLQAFHEWARQWRKELAVMLAMMLTMGGPFLLKPAQSTAPVRYDRRLVIISPHHDRIREEFGHAFAQHWKQSTGQTLYIDWRVLVAPPRSPCSSNPRPPPRFSSTGSVI